MCRRAFSKAYELVTPYGFPSGHLTSGWSRSICDRRKEVSLWHLSSNAKRTILSSTTTRTRTVRPGKNGRPALRIKRQLPYGYIKDPDDPKHWIVDDEAAQIVRRIYSMTLEGFGTEQIAAQLEQNGSRPHGPTGLPKGLSAPARANSSPLPSGTVPP